MPLSINCTLCGAPLAGRLADFAHGSACAACGSLLRVEAFPALLRHPGEQRAQNAPVVAAESTCFFHPTKRVAAVCATCGRFLCALCHVELNGEDLCPQCVAAATDARAYPTLETSRVLYDHVAVALVILPLLFFPLTLVTAPAALVVAIRKWNAPSSIVPRRPHVRLAIAAILALLQIGAWAAFIISRLV